MSHRVLSEGKEVVEQKAEEQSSSSDVIPDNTGQLDVRFALWREFCAENDLPLETLPSELSGEAKAEWEKRKEIALSLSTGS